MSGCGCEGGFTIVAGDTLPVLRDALAVDGLPLDLTGATVQFVAVQRELQTRLTKTPVIVGDPADGFVDVTFGASDLYAGLWDYRYVVTIGAAVLSVPSGEPLTLTVEPRM